MKVVFCGDCVIHDPKLFSVSDRLCEFIQSHDYGVCNFEGPIREDKSVPIIKAGSHIYNSQEAPGCLRRIGFNIAALANNHIMDYGRESLLKTIKILKEHGFEVCGAGNSAEEAYQPLVLEKGNEKVCIVNAAQAEFGVNKNNVCDAGYAWINSPRLIQSITEQSGKDGQIIVFAHCGLEGESIPLPYWRDKYRSLVDLTGAILIASHPHIVQGFEHWKDVPIYYSLGNFYFDKETKQNDKEWNRSLLISMDTETGETKAIPVSMRMGVLDFDETKEFQRTIEQRSAALKDEEAWERWADQISEKYWKELYGDYYSRLIEGERIYNIVRYCFQGIMKRILKRQKPEEFRETMLLHNLQIETHKWIVERYLYNNNRKINDFSNNINE